jgi:hypothetical protein
MAPDQLENIKRQLEDWSSGPGGPNGTLTLSSPHLEDSEFPTVKLAQSDIQR